MAKIATCPKCAKQLALPESFETTDRAECPECRAIFSLSETVQIALPMARVLEADEQPGSVGPSTSSAVDDPEQTLSNASADTVSLGAQESTEESDSLASNAAPLKSWEERLKKALALDTSEQSPAEEEAKSMAEEPATAQSPSFDFKLDAPAEGAPERPSLKLDLPDFAQLAEEAEATEAPPAPTSPQPTTPQPTTPQPTTSQPKTLADFAASAAQDSSDTLHPRNFLQAEVRESIAAANEFSADDAENEVDSAEVIVKTVPGRRTRSWGLSRVTAFALGPVVGSLLGLYGLLWVRGEQADYLGMARVLPQAMLPGSFSDCDGGVDGASPLAEASSPEVGGTVSEKLEIENVEPRGSALSAARELAAKKPQRDAAVKPAAATEAVPEITQTRIDAHEFGALVNAAEAALPDFVAGDLSTPESIRRKGQAYMTLCRLADHFDFARQPGLAPAVHAEVEQAKRLFEQAASQTLAHPELSHIAARWWSYAERPSPGIFLTGQVRESQTTKTGTRFWLKIDAQSDAIPVLFKRQKFDSGDSIGVVGKIVPLPSVPGSNLPARLVVEAWYGFEVPPGR